MMLKKVSLHFVDRDKTTKQRENTTNLEIDEKLPPVDESIFILFIEFPISGIVFRFKSTPFPDSDSDVELVPIPDVDPVSNMVTSALSSDESSMTLSSELFESLSRSFSSLFPVECFRDP